MDFSWKERNVLVTGATGFIAQHLISDLLEKGAQVKGVSLAGHHNINHKNFLYFCADIRDKDKIQGIIKEAEPEIVFHLAAYPDGAPTFKNTDECIQNNIQGTLNIIHSLKDIKLRSFIHIGSYKEYSLNSIPFKEDDSLSPLSSYAISKASAEMFCMSYHKLHGYPITCVRFPTLYGPMQPSQNLIPYLIQSALSQAEIKLTKGEQKRELLYISDAVRALEIIALTEKANGEILNIGTSIEHSIKEIVEMVLKLTDSKTKPLFGAVQYRENEIWRMKGSIKKAKKLLGWKPGVSIEKGLKHTIEFYKDAK